MRTKVPAKRSSAGSKRQRQSSGGGAARAVVVSSRTSAQAALGNPTEISTVFLLGGLAGDVETLLAAGAVCRSWRAAAAVPELWRGGLRRLGARVRARMTDEHLLALVQRVRAAAAAAAAPAEPLHLNLAHSVRISMRGVVRALDALRGGPPLSSLRLRGLVSHETMDRCSEQPWWPQVATLHGVDARGLVLPANLDVDARRYLCCQVLRSNGSVCGAWLGAGDHVCDDDFCELRVCERHLDACCRGARTNLKLDDADGIDRPHGGCLRRALLECENAAERMAEKWPTMSRCAACTARPPRGGKLLECSNGADGVCFESRLRYCGQCVETCDGCGSSYCRACEALAAWAVGFHPAAHAGLQDARRRFFFNCCVCDAWLCGDCLAEPACGHQRLVCLACKERDRCPDCREEQRGMGSEEDWSGSDFDNDEQGSEDSRDGYWWM